MKFVSQFWIRLVSLFRRKPQNRLYDIAYVADFPDVPEKGVVYLLGDKGKEWIAGVVCPCGCHSFIELPLTGRHPKWSFSLTKGRNPTFSPSIAKSFGCQSHFYLKDGKIRWC